MVFPASTFVRRRVFQSIGDVELAWFTNVLTFHAVIYTTDVTSRVVIGHGAFALTLAIGFIANRVGADKVIVGVHHDNMESVPVADVAGCLGSGDDLAIIVFELNWF
jgi:hypothetical protein